MAKLVNRGLLTLGSRDKKILKRIMKKNHVESFHVCVSKTDTGSVQFSSKATVFKENDYSRFNLFCVEIKDFLLGLDWPDYEEGQLSRVDVDFSYDSVTQTFSLDWNMVKK